MTFDLGTVLERLDKLIADQPPGGDMNVLSTGRRYQVLLHHTFNTQTAS